MVSVFVIATQYSLVSFLFAVLVLTVSITQPFVKMGACAPVPYGVDATACYYTLTSVTIGIVISGVFTGAEPAPPPPPLGDGLTPSLTVLLICDNGTVLW